MAAAVAGTVRLAAQADIRATIPASVRNHDPASDPIAYEMLLGGQLVRLPSDAVAAFLAAASGPQRAGFAYRASYIDGFTEQLLALDDPVVNASIVERYRLPASARRRILTGTSYGAGTPGAVPTHAALRQVRRLHPRHLVHSADAAQIAAMLGAERSLCAAYQSTGCLRLIDLGAFDRVIAYAAGTAPDQRAQPLDVVAAALADPIADHDPHAARHALEALTAKLFDAALTTPNPNELGCHLDLAEPDWDRVDAEVRRTGLRPGVAAVLARHEQIPDGLAHTLLVADPTGCAPYLASRSTSLARTALDLTPLDRSQRDLNSEQAVAWTTTCVRRGLFTLTDLATRAFPAGEALIALHHLTDRHSEADRVVHEIADRHGPLSVDGWLVAAALLGDFPGTLSELLTTAAAATAP